MCTNYADEITLVSISQRYKVNIAMLTSGNGYWSMTHFAVLEGCKLVFLSVEHKTKASAFLPTKWCIQNRKPVIPLSPELKEQCNFSKALEKFIFKSSKDHPEDNKLHVSPKMFYNAKNVIRSVDNSYKVK